MYPDRFIYPKQICGNCLQMIRKVAKPSFGASNPRSVRCLLNVHPEIAADFRAIVREHTAGSPVEPDVVWTHLTATDLAAQLTARGHPVSPRIVDQLLGAHGYHRRAARKSLPMGDSADRDE
jgi:hypothetical protein